MNNMLRFEIPTPFTIGRVNCYAFTGDGLTLLDPGPATDQAYRKLSVELEKNGFSVADVDRILITHPHMDHFGIANRIVEESGARAVSHEDATRRLGDPIELFDREQEFFRPYLQAMGVPERYTETAVTLSEAYMDYQEPLAIDHEITDDDIIDVGMELQTIHTPGHAPGSVCFVQLSEGVAFTGDHVLEHVSPNPLLTVTPGPEQERTRSLPLYLDSLQRIQDVDAGVGHAGHGERISDLVGRVQEILDHHNRRKATIADMLEEVGAMTAYDIMQDMFPDLPATEFFPGMAEVIGHLDLLEDEDRVDITEENGICRYVLS